jgi:hypothetical protein
MPVKRRQSRLVKSTKPVKEGGEGEAEAVVARPVVPATAATRGADLVRISKKADVQKVQLLLDREDSAQFIEHRDKVGSLCYATLCYAMTICHAMPTPHTPSSYLSLPPSYLSPPLLPPPPSTAGARLCAHARPSPAACP